jgi:1-deoxy-D-xylulose-5-phosphate reductoisomerase
VAVQAFLDQIIPFKDIAETIRVTMNNHESKPVKDLEDVLTADRWARKEAQKTIGLAAHST